MIAAMDGSHADGAAFVCLLALAKSATEVEEWKVYLSLEEIAERARVQVRSARRAMRHLEAIGEVHANIMHGRQGVNLWRLETGRLMRQARERYPDRRYSLDDTGNTPDRMSGGRTVGPQPRTVCPGGEDRRSVTPDRRSPGEGSRGILEREGEGARTTRRGDAADAPPQAAVAPAGAPLRASPGLSSGDSPDVLWSEADPGPHWERRIKNAGAQAHNGQAEEWAQLATDIGCETRHEAEWMIRCFVRFGKKQQPSRSRPWALSELIGLRDAVSRSLRECRTLTLIKQGSSS